jgi:hypothetical protein
MPDELRYKTQRYAPGIYIGKLWGVMDGSRFAEAVQKRIEFVNQFDDPFYVMVYDMQEVTSVERPTMHAGRIIRQSDPRALAMILVGGPPVIRTFATVLDKGLMGKSRFKFSENLEEALKLAEAILAKRTL